MPSDSGEMVFSSSPLAKVKLLEELMIELMDKGLDIEDHVRQSLKSGRSLASISEGLAEHEENRQLTAHTLEQVEMNLLSLAFSRVSRAYADAWQRRIDAATNISIQENQTVTGKRFVSRMVSGIPKNHRWIRVQLSELGDVDRISELIIANDLETTLQPDGFTLLHGKQENVQSFLAEVRHLSAIKMGKVLPDARND